MRELYPPPFERPLLQGGTLLRTFPFFVFDFTNLTPMDEVFLFFQFLRIFYAYF